MKASKLNKTNTLGQEVAGYIKDLTRHPETGENCGQDYSDTIDMIDIFIQSGYASFLLERFWQRKSDACPLDVTDRDNQLNEFEEWLKDISFKLMNDYEVNQAKNTNK